MAGVETMWPLTLGKVGGGQHVEYDLTIDMKTKMHGQMGLPPPPSRCAMVRPSYEQAKLD